ncbi:MAG: efflux RND transporter periplasmic adaptor subunit [Alphaproteobacteria bacterium]|nr:efflux RND transporter periplasmic adaptor subunit [Alphaproteobacteria bacterium]MDE2042469.1 efflux RND transporter periplasmic adaptor subunit [Alphaproteobacteria bacterium]MDE2340459.1 efflux RND transporter periplasmic adaptor subunit [Alphaproteobacteria bacterium]
MRIPAALMIAATLLSACSKDTAPTGKADQLPVDVVTAGAQEMQTGALSASPTYPATIAYDRESTLSLRVGGTLTLLRARIGDTFGKGALLATIDSASYAAQADRAAAESSRLARDAQRNHALVAAGALSPADAQDSSSALSEAQAGQRAAAYDLRSTRLIMPFAGVVLTKNADVGATVSPGQPLLTVADLNSQKIARVQVPQDRLGALHRGQTALLSISGNDDAITAHIQRIGAATDPRTGTVEVDLALDKGAHLPSGTVGSARFAGSSAGQRHDQSSPAEQDIPAEALVDNINGEGHVFIVTPQQTAQRVPIRILGFDGDYFQVLGLPPGVQVITSGAGFVSQGQRIAVQAQ